MPQNEPTVAAVDWSDKTFQQAAAQGSDAELINVSGSGYITAINAGGFDDDTGILLNIEIDGSEVFDGFLYFNDGAVAFESGTDQFNQKKGRMQFVGPMRFDSSFIITERNGNTSAAVHASYLLD